jgi:hypothetical protein
MARSRFHRAPRSRAITASAILTLVMATVAAAMGNPLSGIADAYQQSLWMLP